MKSRARKRSILTASQLAAKLGISRATIFSLRKSYPDAAPKTFDDVAKWRRFAMNYVLDPDVYMRLVSSQY